LRKAIRAECGGGFALNQVHPETAKNEGAPREKRTTSFPNSIRSGIVARDRKFFRKIEDFAVTRLRRGDSESLRERAARQARNFSEMCKILFDDESGRNMLLSR
jgi:hypothetical protein